MSQAGIISITDHILPPDVPTSFVTDINSPAIPAANVLNVPGGSVSTDNVHGIQTDGSSGSNTLTIELTNRLTGSVQTTDATPTALITFALSGSASVYRFDFNVCGRDIANGNGVGYNVQGTIKTNGTTATIIETPYIDNDEDATLISANIDLITSVNSAVLQVTGVAGRTINYKSVGTYVVV